MKYDGDFVVQTTEGVQRYPTAEDYGFTGNGEFVTLYVLPNSAEEYSGDEEAEEEAIAALNLDHVISYGFEAYFGSFGWGDDE